MKYRIKYSYNTGDSFKTERDIVRYLEGEWENLDIAKKNLQRIKEHYEYYCYDERNYDSKSERRKKENQFAKKDWYVKGYQGQVSGSLKLEVDSGTFFQISAPWCGYFESLNEVEIEADVSDMKVSFR